MNIYAFADEASPLSDSVIALISPADISFPLFETDIRIFSSIG